LTSSPSATTAASPGMDKLTTKLLDAYPFLAVE
jgi:hypothetical protein